MSTSSGPTGPGAGVQGITEADIANYLAQTPGFFERHDLPDGEWIQIIRLGGE